jgi:aminobenzoyl-glutamate transport protein
MTRTPETTTRTRLQRALDAIEWAGNALPHPATLFVALSGVVVLLSWLLHAGGAGVTHPMTGATVTPVNLLSVDGLQRLVLNLVPNFVNFAPFGPVIVSLLGLSVAEQSGLLGTVVRLVVGATPGRWLTATVVFAGAMSHTVGDVGYVLLLPLGAALFHSTGRHPLAGLAASFMGVSGGFAANLLLSPTDVILAGLTQEAARLVDGSYAVSPMASYYFLAASVLLVTTTGTLVTDRIVEPRLGAYSGKVEPEQAAPLSHGEWRGLWWALGVLLVLTAGVLWGLVPDDGFLQDPKQPGFVGSYFLRGLVFRALDLGPIPLQPHQHHHAALVELPAGADVLPALRAQGGHRDADGDDAAVHADQRGGVAADADAVGVARPADGPGRAALPRTLTARRWAGGRTDDRDHLARRDYIEILL